MERIVFLDRDTLKADFRRPAFAHEWNEYGGTSPDEIVERLKDASICICNKVRLGPAELSRLPRLRFIAVAATGVDNIALDYCRKHSIAVSNVRNYARQTVAEHVFTMILALRRNLIGYRRDVRDGAWQRATGFCLRNHQIQDLHGSTLGIIGYGALGQAVAKLAAPFGITSAPSTRKAWRAARRIGHSGTRVQLNCAQHDFKRS
jgi:glycerate dehydrogenase